MTQSDLTRFYKILDYTFSDETLITTALTHRSANSTHNERLEFLGDSVLGLVISTIISEKFPSANEGELSRLRASLVKGTTLAKVANEIFLGDWILLGSGELKSGGFRRDSILADALEAVFGAIYLDGGYEKARHVILYLYRSRLDNVDPAKLRKDPKTELQEHLQSKGMALPEYRVVKTSGKAHLQTFQVECDVPHYEVLTLGEGLSRRKAEQDAAKQALDKIILMPKVKQNAR